MRRGHEVAFATGKDQAPLLARFGLQRLPRDPKDGDSFQVPIWFWPLSVAIQVKHLEYALEQFPADVIVGQPLTLGAVIVAERTALPLAVLGLANYLWPTGTELLERPPITEQEQRAWGRYQEMMQLYNDARKLFRLIERREDYCCSPLLGDLYLLQSVPELAGGLEGFPDPVRFVGSCLWEPEEVCGELENWLIADDPRTIVYVQCGRTFDHPSPWRVIAGALADAGIRIAASIGRGDDKTPPPADWFVRDHVPQGQVLPRASAVITGGNSTAILGALTHGLPLLILPSGGEQCEAAERCTAAGAALQIKVDELSPSALTETLQRLLHEPAFRLSAKRLARAFAVYNGPHHASDLLEDLGARHGHALQRTGAE
jgi:UDP:flavonoid glycosyltransferase YjiC (YdhE family)